MFTSSSQHKDWCEHIEGEKVQLANTESENKSVLVSCIKSCFHTCSTQQETVRVEILGGFRRKLDMMQNVCCRNESDMFKTHLLQ